MRTINLGNGETASIGISQNADGTFTALTLSASKTFKTYSGAEKWMASRGYESARMACRRLRASM